MLNRRTRGIAHIENPAAAGFPGTITLNQLHVHPEEPAAQTIVHVQALHRGLITWSNNLSTQITQSQPVLILVLIEESQNAEITTGIHDLLIAA